MSPTPWRNNRHAIKCCKDCVPPKRYPGCGANCKEYKDEKAEYAEKMRKEKEYVKNHRPVLTNYDFDKY